MRLQILNEGAEFHNEVAEFYNEGAEFRNEGANNPWWGQYVALIFHMIEGEFATSKN